MKKQKNSDKEMKESTKFPNRGKYRGDSLNEHHAIETANVLIGESEIGQQNENL